MSKPEIKWNPKAEVFFITIGNVRLALTKKAANDLAQALMVAVVQTDTSRPPELPEHIRRIRSDREKEIALSAATPGTMRYEEPEPSYGKRVDRKPRLDEMDGSRQ